MSGRRRLRPGSAGLLGMMLLNGLIAFGVLHVLLAAFGIRQILPDFAASHAWAQEASKWESLWPLIPGAAIGCGCLWFWLIVTGRTERGVNWASALVYGVVIALLNVPSFGLLAGILNGNPLLGLLISMALMIMMPALTICMAAFGLTMGAINGWLAQRWIARNYPKA
ncbi:MAG TPA: hypothetical protein VKU00_20850 [Chthonomonadaceae bacterium]|nr:hypothetical protein [Chthonomonadaceae bacterium]